MTTLHVYPDPQQAAPALEAQARAWAEARLSSHRFLHTEGVVATITQLCAHHQIAEGPALRLAGWIHDAAKELPPEELLAQAEALGIDIRPVERACPDLLHGDVALGLARRELGIDDPVITSAVRYHTTGAPEMSRADRAFYLADLIEPSRSYAWIMQARKLAYEDLDAALLFALTYQLRRLLKRGDIVDPRGIELRNHLLLSGVQFVPHHHE
ncbi:MAG: bis(5'-nucleosyl)-tetraphosphatase (symmetrical) YqeK [Anaerolineae bacterium]|nr:bis(5'-nucleosyl)-tetraphosphatase (symmetrical) YqeK [Anaerolineae bacterium]